MPKERALETAALLVLLTLNVFFLSALIFSQGILKGENVSVPDLSGRSQDEARAELVKKDLVLVRAGREFDDAVPRDRVLRQDPAAGSRIRVTSAVRVVLSAGSRDVTVPACEGKMLEAVLPVLRESGLSRGLVSQIHTDRWPAGKIIAQKPAAGAPIDRTGAVDLLISQGDREDDFVMPDLIQAPADRAVAWLKSMGFRVADIRYVYYPGLEGGIVIRQTPPGGYRVQKRNLITLEVSRS